MISKNLRSNRSLYWEDIVVRSACCLQVVLGGGPPARAAWSMRQNTPPRTVPRSSTLPCTSWSKPPKNTLFSLLYFHRIFLKYIRYFIFIKENNNTDEINFLLYMFNMMFRILEWKNVNARRYLNYFSMNKLDFKSAVRKIFMVCCTISTVINRILFKKFNNLEHNQIIWWYENWTYVYDWFIEYSSLGMRCWQSVGFSVTERTSLYRWKQQRHIHEGRNARKSALGIK